MQVNELRGLVLMALKQGCNQFLNVVDSVGNLIAKSQKKDVKPGILGRSFVERGDDGKIKEVIWTLIVQGVLTPGTDTGDQHWPHFRLTDYGKRCLAEERILPHDPDGYLLIFATEVPNADPLITEYLTEAPQCFLHNLNRATAVMLGGASEKAVLILTESLGSAIKTKSARERYFAKLETEHSIFRKYKVFEKKLESIKGNLPKELRENLDSLLRGIFDLIRNSRNDAGHPAIAAVIDRDIVYSHLRLFIPYCKRIYELIEWLDVNKI